VQVHGAVLHAPVRSNIERAGARLLIRSGEAAPLSSIVFNQYQVSGIAPSMEFPVFEQCLNVNVSG
jgi:hypothetical protein